MNEYWESKGLDKYTWGFDMIKAAFDGTQIGELNFGTVGRTFRNEAIKKGLLYLNVYPYAIWEMQDQINDCRVDGTNEDPSVKAWDDARAALRLRRNNRRALSETGAAELLERVRLASRLRVAAALAAAKAAPRLPSTTAAPPPRDDVAHSKETLPQLLLYQGASGRAPIAGTVTRVPAAEALANERLAGAPSKRATATNHETIGAAIRARRSTPRRLAIGQRTRGRAVRFDRDVHQRTQRRCL